MIAPPHRRNRTDGQGNPGGSHCLALLVGYGRGAAALADALEARDIRVLELDEFETGQREVQRLRPDLVLVGTDPAAGDPLAFMETMASGHHVVLYLADRSDRDMVGPALDMGADDVVCPPHSAAAIEVRCEVARRRLGVAPAGGLPPRQVSFGTLSIDLTTRQVMDGAKPLTLSGREFELLVHLMEAGGKVVSRGQLLQTIWGEDQASEAVLDATVHRLRRKLDEVLASPDVVATVRGVGYRLEVPPEPTALAGD